MAKWNCNLSKEKEATKIVIKSTVIIPSKKFTLKISVFRTKYFRNSVDNVKLIAVSHLFYIFGK